MTRYSFLQHLGLVVLLAALPFDGAATATPVDADILLRGGTLYVGDGGSPWVGDVAISGERIVAIGKFALGRVQKEFDCRGLVVTPGFIDLHNHSDRQVLRNRTRAVVNFLTQGCTTIVTGNCGDGPVDAGEYYDAIDELGVGLNVAHLIPQGAVRRTVVGSDERDPSPDELERMKALIDRAMRDGAWGMSTGLIYVPSSYAGTDELVALAEVVARHGGIYASHIRNENTKLLSAIEEAVEIGRRAELPVHVSHFKSTGKDSWGLVRTAAERIEAHRESGATITADQYPYTASSTSLGAIVVPAWARAGDSDEMLARLDDAQDGPRIRSAIAENLVKTDGGMRLQIASFAKRPEWAGQRLAEVARQEDIEPLELVLEILRGGGASMVNHSIDEGDVRYVMQLPWVATASDGRAYLPGSTVPHPRNYGTFTRKIGHYSIREKVIPLEQAIRSATGLPAQILGVSDRGVLRVGYWADVIVWDPNAIEDLATFQDPHSYSRGMHHVFVNGQPALVSGTPTGALAGRALRHGSVDRASPVDETATRIERIFSAWDRPDAPGIALGIALDGVLVDRRGYGSANLDFELPLDTDSVFYLASVSKQFVAACIALLHIDGRLSLDDDVRRHIPELPRYETTITVRQLVHHTSGLRDYVLLMDLAGKHLTDVHSDDDLLALVCRQRELDFRPGERHQYSNTGYLLLAEIVGRVSGTTLREFAEERIFSRLGMRDTRFHDDRTRIIRNRVTSYDRSGDGFRVSYIANWDKVGSGGLLSTVEDLALWDRNFATKEVGGEALLDLLHTRGVLSDGTVLDYAFGLVHGEYKGLKTVAHNGSFMGFRTTYLRFPANGLSVILLSNMSDTDPRALAHQVADVYLVEPIGEALAAYAGRFGSDELQVTCDVAVDGADLTLLCGDRLALLAPSPRSDTFSASGREIVFTRDENRRVTSFRLGTGRSLGVRFERQSHSH